MNTTNKLGPTAPETQEVLRPKTIADFLSDPPKMTCGYCGKLTQEQAATIKDLTYERDQLLQQKEQALLLLQKYDALWKDVERQKREIAELRADKERLDFLGKTFHIDGTGRDPVFVAFVPYNGKCATLRQAIDAARESGAWA